MKNLSWLPIGISGKDHGNKNGQKTTYSETIGETFIQSSMNIITLPKTISHIAGEWH